MLKKFKRDAFNVNVICVFHRLALKFSQEAAVFQHGQHLQLLFLPNCRYVFVPSRDVLSFETSLLVRTSLATFIYCLFVSWIPHISL